MSCKSFPRSRGCQISSLMAKASLACLPVGITGAVLAAFVGMAVGPATAAAATSGTAMTFRHADPAHEPAISPLSNPGSLLVTDNALFSDPAGTVGLSNYIAPGPQSSWVDGSTQNALPAGANEMYNDGSVRWVPLSNIHVHMCMATAPIYFGW